MNSRICIWLLVFAIVPSTGVGGSIDGQARDLPGAKVVDVTAIVLRSDGAVLFTKTFRDGHYTITIPDSRLFENNKSVSILFTSPGRDDARLDNVLGTVSVEGLDMVLPIKYQAGSCQSSSSRCRFFRSGCRN